MHIKKFVGIFFKFRKLHTQLMIAKVLQFWISSQPPKNGVITLDTPRTFLLWGR